MSDVVGYPEQKLVREVVDRYDGDRTKLERATHHSQPGSETAIGPRLVVSSLCVKENFFSLIKTALAVRNPLVLAAAFESSW